MELKTDRLFIRTLSPEDWRGMGSIWADFAKSKYSIYDAPMPAQPEAVRDLTTQFAESNLFFAVLLPDRDDLIGYVCFHKDGDNYDVGYSFHSAYHGKGYARESVYALIQYFAENYGVRVFTAGTALENRPSCRLLEHLGFECVSTELLSFHKDEHGGPISFVGGMC